MHSLNSECDSLNVHEKSSVECPQSMPSVFYMRGIENGASVNRKSQYRRAAIYCLGSSLLAGVSTAKLGVSLDANTVEAGFLACAAVEYEKG